MTTATAVRSLSGPSPVPQSPAQRPQGLLTSTSRDGSHAVVCVQGELDIATAPHLRLVLQSCADRREDITLDLRRLDFVDASGLRPLVEAHHRARRQGNTFTIATPSPAVRRVLTLTRLAGLMDDSCDITVGHQPDRSTGRETALGIVDVHAEQPHRLRVSWRHSSRPTSGG
ncbi:STAS domain-containing protein [Streptomyces sp. NPDC002187]|uniref:STAS domain-containing protein n=1 Tax=Streptomyces sp. NPDC002187 TaxID=3364637 RepID=UPI0036A6D5E2